MKKYILDLTVTENLRLHANYVLLKLTSPSPLPEMLPGQFAEIRVDGSPTTFLRRPISINYVDRQRNEVWFLIQLVGDGTKRLGEAKAGDIINVVLPLGNCFTMPEKASDKLLLVGGGVGTAPMLSLIHIFFLIFTWLPFVASAYMYSASVAEVNAFIAISCFSAIFLHLRGRRYE